MDLIGFRTFAGDVALDEVALALLPSFSKERVNIAAGRAPLATWTM